MNPTDLDEKLDSLIERLTAKNKEVQEKKESGPWGWVVGIVIALISLVGIGVAMYYANKRAKELAAAKTKIEQDKVDQDQQLHQAKKYKNESLRRKLIDVVAANDREIHKREQELKEAEEAHAVRAAKVKALKAWSEINES